MVLSSIKAKARKVHICDWCCQPIRIGEIYQRSGNIYDGNLYTWKNHLSCEEIAQKLNMFWECDEGVTADDFSEIIDAAYHEIVYKNHNRLLESEEIEFPEFKIRLKQVLEYYNISHTI